MYLVHNEACKNTSTFIDANVTVTYIVWALQ